MISREQVSAIVVTRGNVALPCLKTLALFDQTIIWDNATASVDQKVFGRYAAMEHAAHDAVFVQDDDFVLPPDSLEQMLDEYQPGVIVANMATPFQRNYPDSALLGMGAIFDRALPAQAFARFRAKQKLAIGVFVRTCDVIFTALTPVKVVDVPVEPCDWCYADDRMYRQPNHATERQTVLEMARRVRDQ